MASLLLAISFARGQEGGHTELGPVLYGTSSHGQLYQVDPQTGAATSLGQVAKFFGRGLTYDAKRDLLFSWGGEDTSAGLLAIDPHTHKVVQFYATGTTGYGLAWQQTTGLLWTMAYDESHTIHLATIDLNSSAINMQVALKPPTMPPAFASSGPGDPQSLAFHPQTNVLYVGFINDAGPAALATADTSTGTTTLFSLTQGSTGLAMFWGSPTIYVLVYDQYNPGGVLSPVNGKTARTPFDTSIAFAPHVPGWRD